MQQFDIILKNYKIKSYHLIALLIVFLNLSVFIFLLFSDGYFYNAIASLFLLAIYFLYRFYIAKKTETRFFIDEFSLFILAGSWVALQNYLAAIGCVVLGILYHFSLQKLELIVDKNSIRKTNFPKSEYTWDVFSNVLIRDNILTLDFNNNRLMQVEIDNEKTIDEDTFNQFAKEQLNAHSGETLSLN